MSDSAVLDQAVARLCGLREEMRGTAGHSAGVVPAQVQGWMDTIDTAIGDLLEVERQARYREAFAIGAQLVDVIVDGPPGRQAQDCGAPQNRPGSTSVHTPQK